MKLAAIAKLIKADEYCKLYKVIYDVGSNYDLYIGTKTAIFPLTVSRKHRMKANWQRCWESARKSGRIFSSVLIIARTASMTSRA